MSARARRRGASPGRTIPCRWRRARPATRRTAHRSGRRTGSGHSSAATRREPPPGGHGEGRPWGRRCARRKESRWLGGRHRVGLPRGCETRLFLFSEREPVERSRRVDAVGGCSKYLLTAVFRSVWTGDGRPRSRRERRHGSKSGASAWRKWPAVHTPYTPLPAHEWRNPQARGRENATRHDAGTMRDPLTGCARSPGLGRRGGGRGLRRGA
jgi:hypothetical protein